MFGNNLRNWRGIGGGRGVFRNGVEMKKGIGIREIVVLGKG